MIIIFLSLLLLFLVLNIHKIKEHYDSIEINECLEKINKFKAEWDADKIKIKEKNDYDSLQNNFQDIDKINAFKEQYISIENEIKETKEKIDILNKNIPNDKRDYESCDKNLQKENKKLIDPTNCLNNNYNTVDYILNQKKIIENQISEANNDTGKLNDTLNHKKNESNSIKDEIDDLKDKIKIIEKIFII